MKILVAVLVSCCILGSGILCIEPYPTPNQGLSQEGQAVPPVRPQSRRPQSRPQRPSLFQILTNSRNPARHYPQYPGASPSVVEVPFNRFQQRWQGMEALMRYLDDQMLDMMREMDAFMPIDSGIGRGIDSAIDTTIDREREEWSVEHPIITEANGTRIMRLTLDMRQFKPEEISVKVENNIFMGNNILMVDAKQESRSGFATVYRQYVRRFSLPDGVIVDQLRSTLSPEGALVITAPMEEEKEEESTEEEEETISSTTTQKVSSTTTQPRLPEVEGELLPESEREAKEERINIIHR